MNATIHTLQTGPNDGLLGLLGLFSIRSVSIWHQLDVRVVADRGGRPGRGDRFELIDSLDGHAVSEPLTAIDTDDVGSDYSHLMSLHQTAYSPNQCPYHKPGRRGGADPLRCTCTVVLQSRLAAARAAIERNEVTR